GPEVSRLMIRLGEEAEVFRSSISIPGRRRPLRHLVAVSEELSKTRAGGNPNARRTILCDDDRAFLLYRIGARFGLPVLAEWSDGFGQMSAEAKFLNQKKIAAIDSSPGHQE